MKNIVISMILLSSAVSFGSSYNPKKIFKSLNVVAKIEDTGVGGPVTKVKSVGGLTCSSSKAVIPLAKEVFSCMVTENAENVNAQAIYEALKVKEVALNPGIGGSYRVSKSVGGLVCIKSKAVVPDAQEEFTCDFPVQ